MSNHTEQGNKDKAKDHEGNAFVTIKVNSLPVEIHRGSQTGLDIKRAASCPSTNVLKLLPQMEVIANDGRVTIKGDEEFVCHPQVGQAS